MARNQQPFYHRVDGVLFTATRDVSEDEFTEALKKALKGIKGVIINSAEIEEYSEPEPGDPLDLM